MKKCSKCNIEKKLTEFGIQKTGKQGRKSYCKECHNAETRASDLANPEKKKARSKKYREENKDKLKAYSHGPRKDASLKRNYGITLDDYSKMLDQQSNSCKICGIHQEELSQSLCVDHCHITGKVRGLLCSPCNRALGSLGDDVHGLQRALNYLKESSEVRINRMKVFNSVKIGPKEETFLKAEDYDITLRGHIVTIISKITGDKVFTSLANIPYFTEMDDG